MKIRYYGCAGYPTGYGVAAAEMCMSLLATGKVDLELRSYGGKEGEKPAFEGDTAALAGCVTSDERLSEHADVVIYHAQPLDCGGMLGVGIPRLNRLRVAYTTWEGASTPPAELALSLARFDQVWVPSLPNKRAFGPHYDILPQEKIVVVPHSFDEDGLPGRRTSPDGVLGRREDRIGQPFRFYTIGHWNGRKNFPGLLRAWARAFTKRDNVELHIQSTGLGRLAFAAAAYAVGVGARDDLAPIKVRADLVPEWEIRAMHRDYDCFVSATRGEAFGLPAFHAALAGRMIITTGGLGSDDFLVGTTADLVESTLQPAADDVEVEIEAGQVTFRCSGPQGVSARTDWREPDLRDLAARMRRVADVRRRDLRYDYNPIERFGRKAVGALAMKALEDALV